MLDIYHSGNILGGLVGVIAYFYNHGEVSESVTIDLQIKRSIFLKDNAVST